MGLRLSMRAITLVVTLLGASALNAAEASSLQKVIELRKEIDAQLKTYPKDPASQKEADAKLLGEYLDLNVAIGEAQAELRQERKDAKESVGTALDMAAQFLDSQRASIKAELRTVKFTEISPATVKNDQNLTQDTAQQAIQNTPWTRVTVGIDVSGASSTDPQSKFFGDVFMSAPLGPTCGFSHLFSKDCRNPGAVDQKDPIDSRFWVWANPRIGSIKQPGSLGGFSSSAQFLSPAIADTPDKIVQSFEFTTGLEMALIKPRQGFGFSGGDNTTATLGVSLIAGFGAVTPLSRAQVTPQIFKVNDSVRTAFAVPTGKDYITFIQPDRDRFFRQYMFGFRLKTYFFKNDCVLKSGETVYKDDETSCEPDPYGGYKREKATRLTDRFPGIMDITYGQNEYVTGGNLKGQVLKIEGFYPLPFAPSFHVFGSTEMVFRKAVVGNPFIADPANDPAVTLTSPSVYIFPNQPNRDRYKIGIAVDILQLIHAKQKQDEAAQKQKVEDAKKNQLIKDQQSTIENLKKP